MGGDKTFRFFFSPPRAPVTVPLCNIYSFSVWELLCGCCRCELRVSNNHPRQEMKGTLSTLLPFLPFFGDTFCIAFTLEAWSRHCIFVSDMTTKKLHFSPLLITHSFTKCIQRLRQFFIDTSNRLYSV